jgi:hypothetical protein
MDRILSHVLMVEAVSAPADLALTLASDPLLDLKRMVVRAVRRASPSTDSP